VKAQSEKNMTIRILALLATVAMLAGCASQPGDDTGTGTACDRRNYDEVTLQPGCTGYCSTQPCAISFRLPESGGPFEIHNRSFMAGTGNNGETVYLGGYWLGSYIFRTENAAGETLATAYLTVSGDPAGGP
jgi:hypothetical protein